MSNLDPYILKLSLFLHSIESEQKESLLVFKLIITSNWDRVVVQLVLYNYRASEFQKFCPCLCSV